MATTKTKKLKHKRVKLTKKSRLILPKVSVATTTEARVARLPATPRPKRTWLWILLFVIGLQLILGTAWYWLYQQTVLSFQTNPSITYQANVRTAIPVEISIESAKISLPVTPATIKNGIWEISNTTATHLHDSARPGEGGNIVVYGHNLKKIFSNLTLVKEGDVITITTANNKLYDYKVTTISVVKPEQIESVLPTEYEILTVYTCTGWLDSKRLVIQAHPFRVRSS